MAGYTPSLPSLVKATTATGLALSTTGSVTFPLAVLRLHVAGSSTGPGSVSLLEGSSTGATKVKLFVKTGVNTAIDCANGVAFTSKVYAVLTAVKGVSIVYASGSSL